MQEKVGEKEDHMETWEDTGKLVSCEQKQRAGGLGVGSPGLYGSRFCLQLDISDHAMQWFIPRRPECHWYPSLQGV
jgi:hypothetical protein